jgi:putative NADH-flavin reductase
MQLDSDRNKYEVVMVKIVIIDALSVTHHFQLLYVGGATVICLDEGPALVKDGTHHHPQREHVAHDTTDGCCLHFGCCRHKTKTM